MKTFISQGPTIFLFLANCVLIYLFVKLIIMGSNLYRFRFRIRYLPLDTGVFYNMVYKAARNEEGRIPQKCKNINTVFDPVRSKKFDRNYYIYCLGIKIFTIISIAAIFLITILPFLNFIGKKEELYILSVLILSLILIQTLVLCVYRMIKNNFKEKKHLDDIDKTDSYYGLILIIFIVPYILLLAFRLYKYNNCKIVWRK